ncbi:MAG: anti-sigma factor family protein [bacterium]
MKCELNKEKLIGYFYQDLEPEEKRVTEEHLSHCETCKKELAELAKTTQLLRTWADEETNLNLKFVPENISLWRHLKTAWLSATGWRRLTIGFGMGIAALLFMLSLFNFEAGYSEGNFSVKLSLWPRPKTEMNVANDPLASAVTKAEFNAWQEQSLQLIQQMIATTEEHQRRELALKLAQFARDLDMQRRQDLRLVDQGLQVFQLSNENRFRRTDETLQKLIRVAAYERSQSQPLQNK